MSDRLADKIWALGPELRPGMADKTGQILAYVRPLWPTNREGPYKVRPQADIGSAVAQPEAQPLSDLCGRNVPGSSLR
jgi:hypothetical protein